MYCIDIVYLMGNRTRKLCILCIIHRCAIRYCSFAHKFALGNSVLRLDLASSPIEALIMVVQVLRLFVLIKQLVC